MNIKMRSKRNSTRTLPRCGILLLAAFLLLTLLACGSTQPQATQPTASAATEPAAAQTTPEGTEASETDPDADTGSRVLVAYYSASGNTERVAKAIADATGADLFEIVPEVPYTSEDLNWTVSDSRVNREHEDEALRDIALTVTTPENFDKYDTVFIGYPIWWGIAAWPVDNFVKGNDFTGKTVIPFATSASSGMGQSGSLLEGMANGGDWQSGQRFSSGASDSSVRTWAESLNLPKKAAE